MGVERALVSVSDRAGLKAFVGSLVERGVEIWATGGTGRYLKEAGVDVRAVEGLTGFPELLGGRVKTLDPRVFAGILADRGDAEHLRQMQEAGAPGFDMVVANLYPFREALQAGADLAGLVEKIDVGGVTLLRAAAKNHAHVAVVSRPEQYDEVLGAMGDSGEVALGLRQRLAYEAFLQTAQYDALIGHALAARTGLVQKDGTLFPPWFPLPVEKVLDLRYGENHHQNAALYRDISPFSADAVGMTRAVQHAGKELSYNNVLDGEEAIAAVREFPDPSCVIIKHATPSGVASAETLKGAWEAAFETDTYSPFGGVVAFNRELDLEAAEALKKVFLELVIAPGFQEDALALLSKKKNLRLLEVPGLERLVRPPVEGAPRPLMQRGVLGGLLVQEEDLRPFDVETWRTVTKKVPSKKELDSLLFAARVVKHVRSNALVFAKGKRTVGIGGGQTARVDASWIACHKGGEKIRGSVMASDAFFPFRDAVDVAAENGVVAIVQPGGSIRDEEVIAACDEHGIAMVLTGHRVFHH
jgi:phosphoribosylaminoimidazolecarboxamide formyltransferase / IMP cyclohydrolase